jgi:signal peptidase I
MAAKPKEDLQKAHRRRKNRESFLETLESIIVAFVLAFVFRAFVVEAFVIPTGSMGPTLYGQHAELECTDCGWQFSIGAEADHRGSPSLATAPVCPNCLLPQRLPPRMPLYSGDRILVLKFLYDFEEPRRWDVIVFRNPNDPAQNYIKRLIGLPKERVELVDGNVTINGVIARKTDAAQESLWMLVHDTRRRATRRGWKPRWQADGGWKRNESGYVLAEAPADNRTAWLTYRHRDLRDRPANILDAYAYNGGNRRAEGWLGDDVCTDLSLTAEVTAAGPESVCVIEMRAYADRFRFELTAEGGKEPTQVLLNGKVAAKADGPVLPVGRAVEIRAANVDHKMVLLVDGDRVARAVSDNVTPEGDVTYEPMQLSEAEHRRFDNPQRAGAQTMAAAIRLGAQGGPVSVEYLRIDRDVYYINERLRNGQPGHATEGNPFKLNADEFFVCGDNSPKSFDSRLWFDNVDRPVVPRRNLVGKAFFVYWPAAGARWHIPLPLLPDPTGWRLVH